MSLSNRATLDQLSDMTAAEVAALPPDQLAGLQAAIKGRKAETETLSAKLHDGLTAKYSEKASAERKKGGKDAGAAKVTDGDMVITATLPKKVEWDQDQLEKISTMITKEWGGDPAEYMKITREVSETKYGAWPEDIRKYFTPARTLGVGKETFEIKEKK